MKVRYYVGNKYTIHYDIAKTNYGAPCILCNKSIAKGTPINWFWSNYTLKKRICFRCMKDYLDTIVSEYTKDTAIVEEMKQQLKQAFEKDCKKEIENALVLEELEK